MSQFTRRLMGTRSSRRSTGLQLTVDVALETIIIVKNVVPLEPAKGALASICSLLTLLQVLTNIPVFFSFHGTNSTLRRT